MNPPSFCVRPRGLQPPYGSKTGPQPMPRKRIESDTMLTPLARGLAILAAFPPHQTWLGNKQIALETGLPAPTVSRLLRSLAALGYVCYSKAQRKYRLAAAALELGYAAIANDGIRHVADDEMRQFAESTNTYVVLGIRDRLDVIVTDSYLGSQAMLSLDMSPGKRMNLGGSLAGAALLAALPAQECAYLQTALERKAGGEWPAQRRRIAEKISQVRHQGFCTSPGEWVPELTSVSTPIHIPNRPPWTLSCMGLTSRMPRTYLERELGPRLVVLARLLQEKLAGLRP